MISIRVFGTGSEACNRRFEKDNNRFFNSLTHELHEIICLYEFVILSSILAFILIIALIKICEQLQMLNVDPATS